MNAVVFEYRAFDRGGAERRGVSKAASRAEAYRQLVAQGLTPVVVRPARAIAAGRQKRLPSRELAHFTYQLGILMSARIPLSEGLLSIAEQERDGRLKEIILDVARRVESGENIAVAMEGHRGALGDVYIETVRSAERTGNLIGVLEHLAEMLERSEDTRRQVRGALMYPTCVSVILTLAVVFLVGFVVPRFAGMFAKRGASLPLFTQLLMDLGLSFRSLWWAYLLAVAGGVLGLRELWRRPGGRLWLDRVFHRVPYLRDILIGLAISRFARVLGMSLASGLSLIESLTLAGRASGRPMLNLDAERMASKVRTGGQLAEVLGSCTYLTLFTRRMLTAGEQAAEIPRMCTVVSKHYEREVSGLTKNISTVIEPLLIVAIAGVVLVVALAIFMPMWDMVKVVG